MGSDEPSCQNVGKEAEPAGPQRHVGPVPKNAIGMGARVARHLENARSKPDSPVEVLPTSR